MKTQTPPPAARTTRVFVLVILLVLIGLGAAGYALLVRDETLMQQELKDRLRTTAAVAAMQFDGAGVDRITSPDDLSTKNFVQVAESLTGIIQRFPSIRSAYIMRKTDDPDQLSFVADADMIASKDELDRNNNGIIDVDEEAPAIGEEYDVTYLPRMRIDAFIHPAVDDGITSDQWGSVISGYAPIIRRDTGKIVAILGLDMDAQDYLALTQSLFTPQMLLLLLFGVGLLIGGIAYEGWKHQIDAYRRLDQERVGLLLMTSHQLGEPLTIFRWSLELLMENLQSPELKEIVKDHIVSLEEGIRRMHTILDVINNAALVQQGRIEYRTELVDLNSVIEDAKKQIQQRLDVHKQTLSLNLNFNTHIKIDPKLIAGVIYELFKNASTYSPDGGAISVRTFRQGKFVQMEVQDNGCGISKSDLPRVFEKFARGLNASRFNTEGTGLGLFIAKGVVERAGGSMWITSKEGKGTTVGFQLPIS